MGDRAVYRMSCPWCFSARPPTVLHVGWLLGSPNRVRSVKSNPEILPVEPEFGLPTAHKSKSGATRLVAVSRGLARLFHPSTQRLPDSPCILGRSGKNRREESSHSRDFPNGRDRAKLAHSFNLFGDGPALVWRRLI